MSKSTQIIAIYPQKDYFGLAFADPSTGEFQATELKGKQALHAEISCINPAEIVLLREHYDDPEIRTLLIELTHVPLLAVDFHGEAATFLKDTLHVSGLKGFGIDSWPFAIQASALLLHHIIKTAKQDLPHIDRITAYTQDNFMHLGEHTIKNLQLFSKLLPILDKTQSSMGGRLLRKWLTRPLIDRMKISARHAALDELKNNEQLQNSLHKNLKKISDLERLLARISSSTGTKRDLIELAHSLQIIPVIKEDLEGNKVPLLSELQRQLVILNPLADSILAASDEIDFLEIRAQTLRHIKAIKQNAQAIAELDVLFSFAKVAIQKNYCRPEMTTDPHIKIHDGRHPIAESSIEKSFTPNDTQLAEGKDQFILLTGSNASGKSTYLHQLALIIIMAQIGSFVPASACRLRTFDSIFILTGTNFKKEMQEAAYILNHANERSLIIIDEICRGIGTYDGLSLAWSITEFIHDQIRAFTLFATNYHELTELVEKLENAANFSIDSHKIAEGRMDKNYGIKAARSAGIPSVITDRAVLILRELELEKDITADKIPTNQIGLFAHTYESVREPGKLTHPALEKLKELDINDMTPASALRTLDELKNLKNE